MSQDAIERTARVVRQAEGGNRNMSPVRFRQVSDDGEEPRLGTISATWTKGTTATVTRIKADGSAWDTAETFTARNHFATITVSSGTKKVLCVFTGGEWLLAAAECS